MPESGENVDTQYKFVELLPDLIKPEDYASDPEGRTVRFRILAGSNEIELLGDAMKPKFLEDILEELTPAVIEQMLCG